MLLQSSGRIITLSSILVDLHEPGTSAYSATKAAVVEMTKVLARELSSHSITCNVVAPSLMVSESSTDMGEEWRTRMLEKQTFKRTVSIEELCHVIEFFASPLSSAITGQVISTALVT
jgi:3-oxoacyl-[acyl-carrier protein] reductase